MAISILNGVIECVPAYASLLVRFNGKQTNAYRLKEAIFKVQPQENERDGLLHELPVCYDASLAPDLLTAADTLGLSEASLIELHCNEEYLVYQLGYQPGFAFLGETDERLAIDRKPSPRLKVPAGAVGLAGRQTGIYPTTGPGGWQIIGRCPWPMLREGEDWSRLRAGDRVQFHAVTLKEFQRLLKTDAPWPKR